MGDWGALARAVVARRVELGHESRQAFVEASGLSARTLGDIETARRESYDRATLARLERALRWPTGTVDAILRGLPAPEPMPAERRHPTDFGRFLLSAISDAGYPSVTEFARAANLREAAVAAWIYGLRTPDAETLGRIAPLLHVPAADLVERAATDGDVNPGGRPIPTPVAEFLALYWAADETRRAHMLEMLGHLNAMLR